MSPASGRIRAAPRRHQFIQPARRILRSESRRLVTSKETASLPTKEATNVDADGPQGGAQDAHAPECRDEHSRVAPHCRAPSRKTGCWGASRANSANGAFGATLKNRR